MKGNKIVSGMMWSFSEKIAAQVVSVVVSIILARLLMPDDYGVVAIVYIFTVIAEIFVTSGLGTALIQKKDADDTDFSTLFWCNLILSLILYLVLFFFAPVIAYFYDNALLTSVIRVLGIKLPVSAVNSIQYAYVSRKMEFKKFFFATSIGTVVSAVVGISMAYSGFGVWSLVAQYLTNSVIDTSVLFLVNKWHPNFVFSIQRAKPLIKYGWKILATDFIGTVFNQLNAFIIGKAYTPADLAYYTQGNKIPDLVNNNIISSLSAVLFPAFSLSNDIEEIKRIRRKCLMIMGYVVFPLMFGMIAVADKMIVVLMTEKWLPAVPFVRISCVAAVIGIFVTTLIQEIKAIGRSDVTLKIELILKPIYVVIALIALQFGIEAVAWTLVVRAIISFCFYVYPVRQYIGFDFWIYFRDATPSLIMSVIMLLCVIFLDKLIKNNALCLTVQVFVGGIIYIGLSAISNNKSFIYLTQLLHFKN